MQPLVSILIPTYNGEAFIKEALDSVNLQTYENCEVVISDDRSSDASLEIVRKFQEVCRFETIIVSHEPTGIGENWNNCVRHANGAYVKFLFQDDLLFPDCIEKMMQSALNNDEIGLVYCKRHIIDEQGTNQNWIKSFGSLHKFWKKINIEAESLSGKEYLRDEQLLAFPDNKIGEPTAVLLKKEVFESVGFFRNDLQQLLDIEYWYRVMKKYRIAFVAEKLISFRLHHDQTTKKNTSKGVSDYHDFYHILYHEYFKFLHPKVKWKLVWSVTRLRKLSGFFKRFL